MFFGFGWAVLGGFLLTATRNWVKIRGYHGLALIYLVIVWLAERASRKSGSGRFAASRLLHRQQPVPRRRSSSCCSFR